VGRRASSAGGWRAVVGSVRAAGAVAGSDTGGRRERMAWMGVVVRLVVMRCLVCEALAVNDGMFASAKMRSVRAR
jgi:hypothetical protein